MGQVKHGTMLLEGLDHTVGDWACEACARLPSRCGCDSGGIVHNEHVLAEDSSQGYYVVWKCDACHSEGSA